LNNQQIVIPAALYPKIKQQYTRSYLYTPGCYLFPVYIPGADSGGRTPKIRKNIIFWRKIVIFHTKYPKNFRAPLRNWKKYDFLV
jgi:hypothetical protein